MFRGDAVTWTDHEHGGQGRNIHFVHDTKGQRTPVSAENESEKNVSIAPTFNEFEKQLHGWSNKQRAEANTDNWHPMHALHH